MLRHIGASVFLKCEVFSCEDFMSWVLCSRQTLEVSRTKLNQFGLSCLKLIHWNPTLSVWPWLWIVYYHHIMKSKTLSSWFFLVGSLQLVNLFVLYKKNERSSHWKMWGKMFWSLDRFSVTTLSRSSQPEAITEVGLMEERSEVYWFDIWNVIMWDLFMFIYVFVCCSVNMSALMKAAFTQMPEVSPTNASCLFSACSLLSSLACIHPSSPMEAVQRRSKALKWSVIISKQNNVYPPPVLPSLFWGPSSKPLNSNVLNDYLIEIREIRD